MAFCNSCGASMTPGTRFCSKCGAAVLSSSPAAPAAPVPPGTSAASAPVAYASQAVPAPPASGASGLKVVLIIVGVVVLVGFLAVSSLAFFAWRVARHAHVRQEGDNVRVETPFGTVESTKDPEVAARNLGVDVYPGAEVQKDGVTSATFGSVHTTALNFESSDSPDKVCGFYKTKFPNASVMTSQADQCTIVSNDRKGMITINVKTEDEKTRIMITNVTHKSESSGSSN